MVRHEAPSSVHLASISAFLTSDVPYSCEVVVVDDGSTDGSFEIMQALHQADPRVVVVQFRRNFGKMAAMTAGFARARGEIVVTLDADLQDDPEEIPNLLDKLGEGYDLVSGWKYKRHDPISKTLPSKLFNRVTCLISRSMTTSSPRRTPPASRALFHSMP